MSKIRSLLAIAGLSTVLSGSVGLETAFAHHSFGMYDMARTSEIEGTVQKFEWSNPHCWLFVTVASPAGEAVTYGFELSSVGEMLRIGWTKVSLKPGDTVKVKFSPLRDGRPAGLLLSALDANGKMIGKQVRGAIPVSATEGQRPVE